VARVDGGRLLRNASNVVVDGRRILQREKRAGVALIVLGG